MRSSRRNLGLQPEDMPNDSSSQEETRGEEDTGQPEDDGSLIVNSVISDDINLGESEVLKSDASDDEDAEDLDVTPTPKS